MSGQPMYSRILRLPVLLAISLGGMPAAGAQVIDASHEGPILASGTAAGTIELSWWGRSGRAYFIEHSEDLQAWHALPVFEAGVDAPISYGFVSTGTLFFARVRWVEATLAQFEAGDHDGDTLTNAAEAGAGLNPFLRDTDGDTLPDGYELAFGLDPFAADALGDHDGDGVPNREDADPARSGIGAVSVSISAPANGDTL